MSHTGPDKRKETAVEALYVARLAPACESSADSRDNALGAQEAVHHATAAIQGCILLTYIDPNQYLSP